jgi:hypothetical protein
LAAPPEHPGWAGRLSAPAVTVGEITLDLADLVLLGLQLGSWERFEAEAQRGVALEALGLPEVLKEEVRAGATRFRYRHHLLAAAEFRAWLAARSVTVTEMGSAISRALLRAREETRSLDEPLPDVAGVLWVEAVLDGVLRELAREAGDRLAADFRIDADAVPPADPDAITILVDRALGLPLPGVTGLGEPELRGRLIRLDRLSGALNELHEQVADERRLERCLASHMLDWLQIEGEELALATEGAAREARMLMIEDGLAAAEVAERAHTEFHDRRVLLDAAPAEANVALVGTPPGEIAGPWYERDRWRLMLVSRKSPPSIEDSAIRERATRELMREVLDQTLAGRIGWRQPL